MYQSWYEEKITDREFADLFNELEQKELLYRYEPAHSLKYTIDNILLAFWEVVNRKPYRYGFDEEIDFYLGEIYDQVSLNLRTYESALNVNQMLGQYAQEQDAKRIGEAFERALSRSQFIGEQVMDLLDECPETNDECWGGWRDEKSSCAIFTYGESSFHERDWRHPEQDLH